MNIRELIHGFWIILKGYWTSEEKWKAFGLFAVILALSFGLVECNSMIAEWNNEFMTALTNYDEELFLPLIGQFMIIVVIFLFVFVYSVYLKQLLQIRWRTWMTQKFLNLWMKNQNYYKLQNKADNPDQRISEDINQFIELTLDLSIGFFQNLATLVIFSVMLWNLSGSYEFEIFDSKVVIPGYMFWVVLIYSVIGTFLTHTVGKKIIPLTFDQQHFEADFRFSMMRVRENAESIAFYRGEKSEMENFSFKFYDVVANFRAIMTKLKHLNGFTNVYNNATIFAPFIIAAPQYFSKKITFGDLSQISMAFSQVQGALSFFVNSYSSIASLMAVVQRLSGFAKSLEEVEKIESKVEVGAADNFEIENLNISLPSGREILNNLSINFKDKKSILITGSSGCGKSTLLRTLAGIWAYARGKIFLPTEAKLMFLPQKPYLPLGNLKRILAYPMPEEDAPSNEEIFQALKMVGLENLADKLYIEDDWSRILSGGEQQRLAFARVILQKPDYIFLDESTSALDEPREIEMYKLLQKILPNAKIISVGHRSTLYEVHDTELKLEGAGNWNVREI